MPKSRTYTKDTKKSERQAYSGRYGWAKAINQTLFDTLKKNHIKILAVYLIFTAILEILAYTNKGVFSCVAARIWLLGGFLCIMSIVLQFTKAIHQEITEKNFISVGAIALLIYYLLHLIGNINMTEINPDATQQAAAGLESFSSNDFNYTEKAFLGYPSRQYMIVALPSLVMGRSIFSLQLGFSLPFILGIIIFYCGLRAWTKAFCINSKIAILPIYSLFAFPFITEYYVNFEQAILPISLTLMALGFFMIFLLEPNVINILSLAWVCGLMSNSYTPAMASLALMMILMLITAFLLLKRPELLHHAVNNSSLNAKGLLLVVLNSFVFFIATLLDGRKDRMTELYDGESLLPLVFKTLSEFLTDKNAVFMGMLGIITLIYLLASLTLQLKKRDFLLSLWVLGVFVSSRVLVGYTSYQPAWVMQRALIVLPVLVLGISFSIFEWIGKHRFRIGQGQIAVIWISFIILGLFNFNQDNQSFTYFNHIQPMKYMLMDLEQEVKQAELEEDETYNIVLYTSNQLMTNLKDYTMFLHPNAIIYVNASDKDKYPEAIDNNLRSFVYSDTMLVGLPNNDELQPIIYNNQRRKQQVIWYKKNDK